MIARRARFMLSLAFVAACSTGEPDAVRPSELLVVERGDWAEQFAESGVVGTFALHELGSDQVLVHDSERATMQSLPASTFKILNSLISLETGVVEDVDEVIPWDEVERGIDAWNRDHSLRSGIAVSAVWMYQHLAREVGVERMQGGVASAAYGNTNIDGPIDEFWLSGGLRISPLEQLDFLSRLMADDLPFETRHQAAVRDILVQERADDWVWGYKTGTALAARPVLGWLVGYTEFNDVRWVFAMNLDLGNVDLDAQIDPQLRQSLSRTILAGAGALPTQEP